MLIKMYKGLTLGTRINSKVRKRRKKVMKQRETGS